MIETYNHFMKTSIRNTLRMCRFDEITVILNPMLMNAIKCQLLLMNAIIAIITLKALILYNKRDKNSDYLYLL
jgi:hypothetical protein